MQHAIALVLTFVIGAAQMVMPATPPPPISPPPAVIEQAEEPLREGPSIDGVDWANRYEALWQTRHEDEPIFFFDQELLIDWEDAHNIAIGIMADAITVEIYQQFDVPDEYWLEVNLYLDDVPALKAKAFEALFYDAIETGVLVAREEITVGNLMGLMTTIREQLSFFQQPDAEMTEADFYYDEITYVGLWYDTAEQVLRCRICFE